MTIGLCEVKAGTFVNCLTSSRNKVGFYLIVAIRRRRIVMSSFYIRAFVGAEPAQPKQALAADSTTGIEQENKRGQRRLVCL